MENRPNIETTDAGGRKRTVWWNNNIEKNKIFCREYTEQKQIKCGHKIQGLLCKDCEQCRKCQTLQKTNKNCNRHKGCPGCYLIKNHGIKIDDEVNKTIKQSITRKEWNCIINGTWDMKKESNKKPDQGTPSKGTAEPPLGEGLRAPTPEDKELTKHEKASNHEIVQFQKKKQQKQKKWKYKRREGRQCKKLINNWWKIALQPPKKLSKRQDNNANRTHTESTPKILRKRTRNPNRNKGKYRRIIHLLARAEQNKRKSDFKAKKKT